VVCPLLHTRGERCERELLGSFKQVRRPVALFVDDAHLLNWSTLWGLKRLMEAIRDDGGTLAIVVAGQSKTKE
jgi:type II secretory pathway predicted ATPase ExeA